MNARRLASLILLTYSILSFLLVHGSSLVEVVNTPFNNPSILCTGSGCGGGGGCDSALNTIEYSETWHLKIVDAQSAANSYRPGEAVLITGHVSLSVTIVWLDLCTKEYAEQARGVSEVFGVTVTVADSTGSVQAELSGDTFSAKMELPASYEPSHTYTVTANFKDVGGIGTSLPGGETFSGGSASDEREVTVGEDPYAPNLIVKTSHEGFVYPGETIIVSGSGWAPNNEINLEYGIPVAGQSGSPVIADPWGSFTAPPVTVPSDPPPPETSYSISASEPTNGLGQSASVMVQWRPLRVLVADPGSIIQGGSQLIQGTVTDRTNGDKPVDASVKFDVQYSVPNSAKKYMNKLGYTLLQAPAPVTANGGHIIANLDVSLKAAIGMYTITVTAEKPGYKTATVPVSVRVDERPAPFVSPPDVPGAIAGGAGGVLLPTRPKDYLPRETGWDKSGKDQPEGWDDYPGPEDTHPEEGGSSPGKPVKGPMEPRI